MRPLPIAAAMLAAAAGAQQWLALDGPVEPARSTFDWRRGRLVLFSQDGSTWELDGNQLLPSPIATGQPSPSPRVWSSMAFDLAHDRVLMFGGNVQGTMSDETWSWDGERWQQLSSPVNPPGRVDAA